MRWYWDHWLGGAPVDGSTAPLRAEDLGGLPPAYVVIASHDVLRDEGVAYADRLEAAGNDVTNDHVEGAMHGFYSTAGLVPLATDTLARTAAWVKSLSPTP
jgi:acetyl esterase